MCNLPSWENRTATGPLRPPRAHTHMCVVHAFGDAKGITGTTPEHTERFFHKDPEGVATTTLSGSWATKLRAFSSWWDWEGIPRDWYIKIEGIRYPKNAYRWKIPTRIPDVYAESAHIPYHVEIHEEGVVQWQPFGARTSHARGSNHVAVAAVVHWDRKGAPSFGLTKLLAEVLEQFEAQYGPYLEYIGHDESNIRNHIPPKGCPGFDVAPYASKSSSVFGA